MKTVDEYIQIYPKNIQDILSKIRAIIIKTVPTAIESISYGMPAYKFNKKPLIYFAAFSNHIGIYATPSTHEAFANDLAKYKQGKGSVQFPLNQEIPYELITKMILFKIDELSKNK